MEKFVSLGMRVFASYDEATGAYTVVRIEGENTDREMRSILAQMSPNGYPPVRWPHALLAHENWPSSVLTVI